MTAIRKSVSRVDIRESVSDWTPKTMSVCMAYDALRLALGGKPSTFTPQQIIRWLWLIAGLPNAPFPEGHP